MDYILIVLSLLGGMGVFLAGMEIVSNSLSKLAHGKMRTILNKTANNRFAGVGIGTAVTTIIQSSAATTVMVVGLVNAGIMTLFQATSIIMGANIGTTITSYMASLSTVKIISDVFFLFAIIGVFLVMLCKKEKVKNVGSILMGVGLIFVGLAFMSEAINPKTHPEIQEVVNSILSFVKSPILLLLVGIVITALIQSSSAFTSIIVTLVGMEFSFGNGGDSVLYLIIGSNIGTCVTAMFSSIGATTNARRAAIVHLMFNCFGAIIFALFLFFWSFSGTSFLDVVLTPLAPTAPAFQISIFHTIFNVTCTCLFLPFMKIFVWLAEHIVPSKKKKVENGDPLPVLDDRLLRSPSVALGYLYQETGKILAHAMSSLDIAVEGFLNKDTDAKEKVLELNSELSVANKQAISYLVKLSATDPAFEDEQTISSLHYVMNDIVRIGELADNVTKYTRHYVNDGLVFSGEFLEMIRQMYAKIKELYVLSSEAFLNKDFAKLEEVDKIEDSIDKDRRRLNAQHIVRLNEGKCQPENSNIFINLVGNLERAADHITYIAHSIENGANA